ncbi:MAG TPA: polysaccharide biosynthesis/export family protein, partial [Hyphomicrobiaceae bacterium]|nr:polysaccharide biosynthesis/export family protein [Hyphomicrobiaceae bacterium]
MPRQKTKNRSHGRKSQPTVNRSPTRRPQPATTWTRTIALVAPAAASLLLIFGGFGVLQANPGQSDYMLGTADRVRIRVFEWRPARDEVHEWSALNSEYAIGANGRVSMPLIGEVAASGITTADLAKAIGLRLKTRMGLADAPDIAVEVTQYRPFYLSGYVEKPGEYPYRPGLNVGQALALGGGLLRTGEFGAQRLDRELIQTSGDLVLVSQEFNL